MNGVLSDMWYDALRKKRTRKGKEKILAPIQSFGEKDWGKRKK